MPRIPDLHRELARAVLLKPAALTGREFRFLRAVTGLSIVPFAAQLGVAIQTIQAWERCEALRYLNDIGARLVIGTVIAPDADFSSISRTLSSIKARESEQSRLRTYWINDERRWIVSSADEVQRPLTYEKTTN